MKVRLKNQKNKGYLFLVVLMSLVLLVGCNEDSSSYLPPGAEQDVSGDTTQEEDSETGTLKSEEYSDIGVLLVSFGEPDCMVEGYEGWRSFLKNYMGSMMGMMKLGVIVEPMKWMTDLLKSRTLFLDISDPFASVRSSSPNLVDAWGNPYHGEIDHFIPRPTETLFETLFNIPEAGDLVEFM
jgi:hypothetical protein